MKIKTTILVLAVSIGFSNAFAQESDSAAFHLNYAVGADMSFLKMAEDNGTEFKDEGVVKPGLDIFRDHGYDWIRLRLFHTPDRLPNDLEYTIELAQEARERGMKFLLDYIIMPTAGPILRNNHCPQPGKDWIMRH